MADDAMDVEAAALSGMEVESSPESLLSVPTDAAAGVAVIHEARQVVVAFLKDHRTDEVVPDNSRVILLDADISLSSAFRSLLDHGIRAAPVLSTADQTLIGMLTVTDLIAAIRQYRYHRGADISQCMAKQSVRTWFTQSAQAKFYFADAEKSLLESCIKMRDNHIHRLPVVYKAKKVLFTLEHWRVLRFVHQHLSGRDDPRAIMLFSFTLAQLQIGTFTSLSTVRENCPLKDVLDLLVDRDLSAVPIVDENGKLRDVYSRTDVTALLMDIISSATLEMTVSEALNHIRPRGFRLATCRSVDTLGTVFGIFEQSRKQRLYVVNQHGVLEGVLSLRDILVYFLDGV